MGSSVAAIASMWQAAAMPSTRPVNVTVPYQDSQLEPVSRERVRELRRHLVSELRDLRVAKHPEKLIQKEAVVLDGFTAEVAGTGCKQCQGFCCQRGGEHAYIDDRTLAKVRRDRPELDARGIIRLYAESVATLGYKESCVFHGAAGCTLDRSLRAELCNSYYCTGLLDFLNKKEKPHAVVVVAARNGKGQKSDVLTAPALRDGQAGGVTRNREA
jgi:hypothetical protein